MAPSEGTFRVLIAEGIPYVSISDLASGLSNQADAMGAAAADAVREVVGQLLLMELLALQRSEL